MALIAQNRYTLRRVQKTGFQYGIVPETLVLPADGAGNVTSFVGAQASIRITYDGVEILPTLNSAALAKYNLPYFDPNNIIQAFTAVNCTAFRDGASIFITGLSADAGYIDIPLSVGSQLNTTVRLTLAKSKQGVAGRSITSVDVWYYLSTSSSALAGGSWSTTPPAWVNGRYYWTKTITTYSDGATTQSTAACITGAAGAAGAAGRSVLGIVEEYAMNTSKTNAPTSGWSATPPTWSQGYFIWTRSKITYSTAPITEYTAAVCSAEWETVADSIISSLNQTNTNVNLLATLANSSFVDGIISYAEGQAIKEQIKRIEADRLEFTETYNKLFADERLTGDTKTTLLNAKINLWDRISTHIALIESVIADNKATYAEIQSVNSSYGVYKSLLTTFQRAVEAAVAAVYGKNNAGYNLLLASNFGTSGTTTSGSTYLMKQVALSAPMVVGRQYTLVARGASSSAYGMKFNAGVSQEITMLSGAAQTVVGRFTVVSGNSTNDLNWINVFHGDGVSSYGSSTLYWVCLYEGDVNAPLEYTPNIGEVNNENVEVGGVNLVKNGNFINKTVGWDSYSGGAVSYLTNGVDLFPGAIVAMKLTNNSSFDGFYQGFAGRLQIGRKYTLSFAAKYIGVPNKMWIGMEFEGGYKEIMLTAEWATYAFTFTNTQSANMAWYMKTAGTVCITNIQIEAGTKATTFKHSDLMQEAIDGSVDILGGLALGSIIAVKNSSGAVEAGMNGLRSDLPRFWAGAPLGGIGTAPYRVYGDGTVVLENESKKQKVSIIRSEQPALDVMRNEIVNSQVATQWGYFGYQMTRDYSYYDPFPNSGYYGFKRYLNGSSTPVSQWSESLGSWMGRESYYTITVPSDALVLLNCMGKVEDTALISSMGIDVEVSIYARNTSTGQTLNLQPDYSRYGVWDANVKRYVYQKSYKNKFYLAAGSYEIGVLAQMRIWGTRYGEGRSVVFVEVQHLSYSTLSSRAVYGVDGFTIINQADRYFRVSLNDPNYLIRARANMLIASENGNHSIELTDSGVKLTGSVKLPGVAGAGTVDEVGNRSNQVGWAASNEAITRNYGHYTIPHLAGSDAINVFVTAKRDGITASVTSVSATNFVVGLKNNEDQYEEWGFSWMIVC